MNFSSRHIAEEFYNDTLYDAEKNHCLPGVMADLGLRDLWFLMTRLLNRMDMIEREEINPDWLFERCIDIQTEPDGYLDLWAREHYKSTIITFGRTVQDILADPEITVGIFSVKRELAQDFLKQIKNEFQNNDLLKDLYPNVLYRDPEYQSPCWGIDKGIRVKRKQNSREETVEAWGLFPGMPTGKHFKLLIYDDIVTEKSVTNPDMLNKTFDHLRLSYNLGSHGGRMRAIGTRYHFNDAWGSVLKAGTFKERLHPCTDNGTPEGNPVFITPEANADKRRDMGPYIYACQMLQNPKADEAQGFKKEWLRAWQPKPEHWEKMNIYIVVDPAGEKKMQSTKTDYTVMWVIGLGPDERFYLIDGIRDRLNLTGRTNQLFRLVRKYKPIAVGYERYGLQSDIEHIQYEMTLKNYHFHIIELGGATPKNDRIRKLVPVFEQNRFFTPGVLPFCDHEGAHRDLMREFEDEEYLAFPVSAHDDMLDAMARILDADLGAFFPDYDDEADLKGGLPNMPAGDYSQGFHDYDPLEHL